MDPQAAWNEMLDFMEQGDHDSACERAEALQVWIARGGFLPLTIPGREKHGHRDYVVAMAVCSSLLEN